MNNLNYIFFEEFKKLEKLCNEIYSSHSGVTQYIDDMLNISYYHYRSIPNWNSDLKELKRLRHIRNQIAHEQIHVDLCTPADIEWLNDFYKRIFNQTDPLALLHQNISSNVTTQRNSTQNASVKMHKATADKSFTKTTIILLLSITTITLLCLICGWIIIRYIF